MPKEPDELTSYGTNPAFDLLIMREIQAITFEDRMRPYMKGVARRLKAAGVDFSNADITKLDEPDRGAETEAAG